MIKLFLIVAFMVSSSVGLSSGTEAKKYMKKGKGMFHKKDKNGDGKVSKEEWMAKFNEMDKNGDGFLTKKEMKGHMKKWKK